MTPGPDVISVDKLEEFGELPSREQDLIRFFLKDNSFDTEFMVTAIQEYFLRNRQKPQEDIEKKYNELIMAVGNKFDGETRHETALRYIQKAEQGNGSVGEVKSNA